MEKYNLITFILLLVPPQALASRMEFGIVVEDMFHSGLQPLELLCPHHENCKIFLQACIVCGNENYKVCISSKILDFSTDIFSNANNPTRKEVLQNMFPEKIASDDSNCDKGFTLELRVSILPPPHTRWELVYEVAEPTGFIEVMKKPQSKTHWHIARPQPTYPMTWFFNITITFNCAKNYFSLSCSKYCNESSPWYKCDEHTGFAHCHLNRYPMEENLDACHGEYSLFATPCSELCQPQPNKMCDVCGQSHCNSGYSLSPDGSHCLKYCDPPCESGVCEYDPGSFAFTCACNPGFTGDYCQHTLVPPTHETFSPSEHAITLVPPTIPHIEPTGYVTSVETEIPETTTPGFTNHPEPQHQLPQKGGSPFSGGAIAGIILATLVLLAVVAFAAYRYHKNRSVGLDRQQLGASEVRASSLSVENPMYRDAPGGDL